MNNKVYKITLTAILAALIYVATMFFTIPLPGNGYANMGDCFVIIAGFVLGPVYGACAAGIGSALSDLTLGFGIYVPATLIIKAIMAIVAYYCLKMFTKRSGSTTVSLFICTVITEIWMVAGYFIFELCCFGGAVAAADIPGNALQGLVGAIAAGIFYSIIVKTGILNKLLKHN